MRTALLPDALLASAAALALSYAAPRDARIAAPAMAVIALLVAAIPWPGVNDDLAFAGGWISIILTAACVHLPKGVNKRLSAAIATNGGFWAGLISHVQGGFPAVAMAMPFLLLVIGGQYLVGRKWGIAVKVAASWLMAISALEIGLMFVPTPGYAPDHMD